MTPEQEKLAAQVADLATSRDQPPLSDESDADRVASNLSYLAKIANAHRIAQAEPDPAEPCLFEWRHLQIERELGQGGFGTVYQAWDSVLQRRVALKLIQDERASESRDRLLIAEAQRMARVRHVNILAIHGADSADGRTGIWSDLLDGNTLEQLVATHQRLPPAQVTDMAIALTDALALVHRRGIVHGDIKPANIMIQRDGTPVLMDFGAAQGLSNQGSSVGSPLVMAPEQFEGIAATAASDVYGLGATLYFALQGNFPVRADNLDALEKLHRQGAQVDYRGLPLRWRALLRSMLACNPSDRPAATQALERLRAIAETRPRLIRRLASALVMASLAAGVIAATLAYRSSEQSRERTERVKDLVVDAIRSTSPNNQSGPATIEETYTRLAELASERLQDYPGGLADMRLVAAEGLSQLGSTGPALEIARQGHELMLELPGASPMDLSYSWTVLSGVLKENGDVEGSEQALRRSLAELAKLPVSEAAPRKLANYNRLASLAGRRGDWRSNLEAHRQILSQRLAVYGPDSVRVAVDYHNIATAQMAMGEFDAAITNARAAAEILERSGDGQSVRMGYVLQGLAHTLGQAGRYEEAREVFPEARKLLSASLPADHNRLQTLTIAEWGNRYYLGETERSVQALKAILASSELPKNIRLWANRQLGELMVESGRWGEVLEAFTVCVTDSDPRYQHYLPYFHAAMAYARYQLDPSSQPPGQQIDEAVRRLRESGYDRLRIFAVLLQWQADLDIQ